MLVGGRNMDNGSQFLYRSDLFCGAEPNDGMWIIMMKIWVMMTLICRRNLAILTFLVISLDFYLHVFFVLLLNNFSILLDFSRA